VCKFQSRLIEERGVTIRKIGVRSASQVFLRGGGFKLTPASKKVLGGLANRRSKVPNSTKSGGGSKKQKRMRDE